MEYIIITQEMMDSEESHLRDLCKFFEMPEDQIENDMWYFLQGELWSYGSFVLDCSETRTSLFVGDMVIKHGGEFQKIESTLQFLIHDSIACDRMEKALCEIRESGVLDSDMDKVCAIGLGIEPLEGDK